MNYIIAGNSSFSAITNSINAKPHKHWMLQLFLSCEADLELIIAGHKRHCRCAIIDQNVEHSFKTGSPIHFTMVIDTTSNIGKEFKKLYLNDKSYHLFEASPTIAKLQKQIKSMAEHPVDEKLYTDFVHLLFASLGLKAHHNMKYDNRIQDVLEQLDHCDCSDHSLQLIAANVNLSISRLSHLFKQETGIPLKSYIVLHKVKKAYYYYFLGKNITNAALHAGFDSASHFAAASQRLTGMSATNISKNSVFLKVPYF